MLLIRPRNGSKATQNGLRTALPERLRGRQAFGTGPQKGEAAGFNRAWSVYPYTRNGQIYASNTAGFLTIAH